MNMTDFKLSDTAKKWQQKLKTLEQKAKFYERHHLVPDYKPRLKDPSPFWREFFRQRGALELAMLAKEDVHVFAYEPWTNGTCSTPSTGKRKFVVTSYPELWHQIDNCFKHKQPTTFYEVIPEGAACKLYFDLEFQKEYNGSHDGGQMVTSLIEVVCRKLEDSLKVFCSSKDVFVLDASTDTKFSSHLIFNLNNTVFKDNIHVGYFVRDLCDELREQYASESSETCSPVKRPKLNTEVSSFFVRTSEEDDDKLALFIDEGVYTKNRNFRLYKCVKLGKDNPLLIASYGKYQPRVSKGVAMNSDKRLFMDSLITNVKCNSNTRILTMSGAVKGRNSLTASPHSPSCSSKEGYRTEPSPFPSLDDFIKTVIAKGGVQGNVRRWVYFAESGTVLYDIVGNRWCENIKRQHKSNNIMILVNLKRKIFYQKCHDPDCKRADFKSTEHPVPSDCLPCLVEEDYEDEELLRALEMVDEGTGVDTSTRGSETADDAWMQGDVTDEELTEAYDKLLRDENIT